MRLSAFLAAMAWGMACLAGSGDRPQRMEVDDCFVTPPPPQASSVRGFTALGGRWEVSEGELLGRGDGGSKLVLERDLPGDYEFSAQLRPADNTEFCGLIFNISDARVGADSFNGYEASLNTRGKVLRLGRHRNNFELIRDAACDVQAGRWMEVAVRRSGTRFEVRVDGKVLIEHDDGAAALPPGRVGVRVWHGDLRCRNLRVGAEPVKLVMAGRTPEALLRGSVSAAWLPIARGDASMRYDGGGLFAGGRTQVIALNGEGEAGVALARPIALAKGKDYHGALWARSDRPARVEVSLRRGDGTAAKADVEVAGEWRRIPFSLGSQEDGEGRLAVSLREAGEVRLGRVSLAPGDWGWPESLSIQRLPPIVLLARHMLTAPPAVGCDHWASRPTKPGCAILVIDPARPEAGAKTVFSDSEGCIYDMNLSFDAKTVYFSYARKDEKHWHLWRIGVDGSGLRQITDGPFYDVSPCELPDGDLVFISTRRFGHTVCQPGPASNLYRVPAAGGEPRCLSMNTLSDTTPQMLPDGRVLFMRWEYVDRDLTYRQSLWAQNPDGTGYQLFFGNTIRDPGTFWQARPIPGASGKVLATFAPHHGHPHGAIGWIDPGKGLEAPRGVGFDWITQEFPSIGDAAHPWAYRDPFPLDEERFLCAYGGGIERYRIVLNDLQDRRRTVYEHPEMHCFFPIALRPVARPPVLARRAPLPQPGTVDLPEEHKAGEQPMGTFLLVDVYRGLEPAVARGRVKSIRIMEQIRKTEDIPVQPHIVDFGPRAYDQSPLMSYATYYAKRCWGSVPVEADGSAHFVAPALREIYFQACDEEGRELQRMTSAVQVMPGETISCAGCHENRLSTPAAGAKVPLAARRAPSVPQKPAWAVDGIIDFPTVVQPVLDKHCVSCHSGGNPAAGYDFSGDKTRFFSMAYDNLLGRSRSYRQHNMDTGEMLPEEIAKGKPLVHFYWLLKTPTAVNQPLWTGSHASRLAEIIERPRKGQFMPREDRERIYTWIDANVPYYGTFATSRPKCGGKRDLCADPATGEPEAWFARGFMPVYERRCASCHGEFPGTRLVTNWDGRTAWINFTRPKFSPALTAHLPKDAGGRGIDKDRDGKAIPQMGLGDPDYAAMLKAIDEGKRRAELTPGPDMARYSGRRREP